MIRMFRIWRARRHGFWAGRLNQPCTRPAEYDEDEAYAWLMGWDNGRDWATVSDW